MSKKTQENQEVVELDSEALKAVSKQVAESMDLDDKIEAAATKAATEAAEKAADAVATKMETATKKNTSTEEDAEEGEENTKNKAHQYEADSPLAKIAKESKEQRLFKAVKALASNDFPTLNAYKEFALDQRQKAGYGSTDSDADGGYLVPDPEFDTTVYDNLPKYGVAFQFADVRQTTRNAVKVMSLDSGLEFYATDEAGVKQSGKLQFSRKTVDLNKYAVIVPATDELTDDSAVDYWNLVTRELSRAYAKKADEVTFTHATSGITNTTGVITEPVSGAGTTITWEDLLTAEGATEDGLDSSGFAWFMRKETWFRLVQLRADSGEADVDGTGQFLFNPNPNQPTTPWGTQVVFTRVLPKSSEVGSNDAMAVYGDLKNYILYNKRGMALKMLTEATVKDTDDADFNLATQDAQAMRAVVRMLGVLPAGNASKFVVLGTGTVS